MHRYQYYEFVHAMIMYSLQLQHAPEHAGMMFRVDPSEEVAYRASMLPQFIRAVSFRVVTNCNFDTDATHLS